ncbi:hypothetical protein pb186bvf_009363 [Paramecium bursaria]
MKKLGINNLFSYGQFYVYIGSIQSNKQSFTGQMQNIRFKTCLDTYSPPQKNCYSTCLTCFGPLSNQCNSCKINNNRFYDELSNSCKCLDGFFELDGRDQCQVLVDFLKKALLNQIIQVQRQPCQYGQFQFMNNTLLCIQCPNQVSNMKSCGDCLDNLYNWQNILKCSYDYVQYDVKNAYINQYKDQVDYYFIKNNQLQLCYGCELCEQCDVLEKYGVNAKCLSKYYYDSYQCLNCPFNCDSCLSPVGDCIKCQIGYLLIDGQCQQCNDDCQNCEYSEIQQNQACLNCVDNFSIINNICQPCSQNCQNCLFDDIYNINRCIKCISEDYFIQFDGETCQKVNIQNCQIQYQKFNQYNTLVIDFLPQFDTSKIINICALCDPQYLNELQNCQFQQTQLIGEQILQSSGQITYLISYSQPQYVNTNCLIEQCQYCLSQGNKDNCILCNSGFYADIQSGLCYECPNNLNCNSCFEQHQSYEDGWKWDIRAFISFYHPEIELVDIYPQNQPTEIVCKTCQQGYELRNKKCIKICPILCAKCTITNDENICTYCGQNTFGYQLSIYDNQCISCPSNCLFCKPRTLQEIYLINPFFNPDDADNNYFSNKCLQSANSNKIYYDQQLEQYVKCEIGQFCENQLQININAYCDINQYQNIMKSLSGDQLQQFKQENFHINQLFSNQQTSTLIQIETPQLISYMNQQQIKSLTYTINIIGNQNNECTLDSNSQLFTILPKNVFSLTQTILIINGNFGKLIQRGLNIHNFTRIELQNLTLQLPFDIQFNNPISQEIVLKSISTINYQQDQRFLNINIQNPSLILLYQCYFPELQSNSKYTEVITQSYTNNKIQNVFIRIEDLRLQMANIINANFITFKNIINYDVTLKKSLITGIFQNSSILKEESISNTGQILISNVNFSIQATDAPIIQLQNINLQIEDTQFNGTLNKCKLILINTITLQSTKFSNIFLNQAILIDNQIPRLISTDNSYKFSNVQFINISLDSQSNFINIQDNNLQNFLYICNIVISNCFSQEIYTSTKKLIQFQGQEVQIKNSSFTKHLLGLTDIEIKYADNVVVMGVTVQGQFIQGIHESLLCLQKLIKISNQNSFIQFQNVKQVVFSNSTFNNIMIQNQPIILINSFDDTLYYNYLFQELDFFMNLIIITDEKSQGSMIQISSPLQGQVSFQKINYRQNVINEYIQNQIQYSATNILIEAKWFIVEIIQCQFSQNFIFNTSDSIQYIFANKITYTDCKFDQQNIYDDFILDFIVWPQNGEYSIESFLYFYPILSLGGNGQLIGNQIYINNSIFQESQAQQGAGLHITVQKIFHVKNTIFQNLYNKMNRDDSQGGSLYIETIDGQSTIIIENTQFTQSFSLQDGGAIYIQSRFTECDITLFNLTIQDCYSFKGSFLSVYQDNDSLIQINQVQIQNTIAGFNQFLQLFDYISNEQIQQFHQSAYLFYIISGQLIIQQLHISDIQLQGGIYFQDAIDFEIYSSSFQNIIIAQLGILNIYPSQIIQKKIQLIETTIINISNIQSKSYDCEQVQIIYESQLQCVQGESPNHLYSQVGNSSKLLYCNQMRIYTFNNPKQLLYIDQVIQNGFNIISLYLKSISCTNCQNGIFFINQILRASPELKLVNIKGLQINNCKCSLGCLVISNQSQIMLHEISKTRILQNIEFSYNINYTIYIQDSTFSNNTSTNGGLILNQLSLLLENCLFINNNSTQTGGGISFLGQQQINIFNSQFINNIALVGAAIYSNNIIFPDIIKQKAQFINNQASIYGNDIVNEPWSLRLSANNGITLLTNQRLINTPKQIIDQVIINPYHILGNSSLQKYLMLPSGQKIEEYQYYNESNDSYIDYNLTLRVVPLNQFEDKIKELVNTSCILKAREINITNINENIPFDITLLSQSKFDFNSSSQDYNLDGLIIKFDPSIDKNLVLQLQIICNSIKIPILNQDPPYNVMGSHSNYELRINIRTFECQIGEAYNKYQGVCSLCDSSQQFYSVQKGSNKCDIKDDVQMISVTSTKINLKQYYWRPFDDINKIEYCFHLEKNCKGGWITGDGSCEMGHIGALCEQCDLYDIRGNGAYAISGSYQCGECINVYANAITIVIICCWTLISIFISVKGTLDLVQDLIYYIKATKIGFIPSVSDKGTIAILVKILTNYLQIISAIATFQLQFPPGLNDAFSYSGNPIKSLSYSLDCFLTKLSDIDILYFRTIWSLFMPFLYASVIFTIYFIMILLKYQQFNLSVLSTTPDIIGGLVSLISYRKISGFLWVQGNVSYLYMTPSHLKWLLALVMPAFIFVGIVIPTILFLKLQQRKDKLDQVDTLKMFGYLYNEYSKNAYYWEILKICQKELMILLKGTLVFVIIFVYDLFTKTQKPYKRKDLNTLDEQNNFVCAFSVVLGMSIYVATNNGNFEIIWPFFILLGIANILFLIKLALVLIVSYLGKLRPILDKIRDKYLVNSQEREIRVRKRFLKIKNCVLPYAKMVVNLKRHQKLEQARQSLNDLPQLDINDTVVRKNSFRIPNQNNYQVNEQIPALTAKPRQSQDIQSLIEQDVVMQFEKTSKFQKSDNNDSDVKNPESRFLPIDEDYQINDEK